MFFMGVCRLLGRLAREGQRGQERPREAQKGAMDAQIGPGTTIEAQRRTRRTGKEKACGMFRYVFYGCVSVAWEIGQRRPERPREAQRGPERLREAQKGPERPREAQRGPQKRP